jgi:hypothetical protein
MTGEPIEQGISLIGYHLFATSDAVWGRLYRFKEPIPDASFADGLRVAGNGLGYLLSGLTTLDHSLYYLMVSIRQSGSHFRSVGWGLF